MRNKRLYKGQILRIKQGYNPNSSSVGTILFPLKASILAITAAFSTIAGIILSVLINPNKKSKKKDKQ